MTVSIFQDHEGVLYAGTPLFLRCVITLSDLVTIPVIVTNQWTLNGISVSKEFENNSTLTDNLIQHTSLQYESILYFNPLNDAYNSGEYSCNIIITANFSDDQYVLDVSVSANTSIFVECKFVYFKQWLLVQQRKYILH